MIDERKLIEDIKGWQEDIHDNEYDAKKYDFVFERIYEMAEEQPRVGEWIPCGKEKPRGGENIATVKWYDRTVEVVHAYYDGFDWITGCGKRAEVIAWMPLPPAFEGE